MGVYSWRDKFRIFSTQDKRQIPIIHPGYKACFTKARKISCAVIWPNRRGPFIDIIMLTKQAVFDFICCFPIWTLLYW